MYKFFSGGHYTGSEHTQHIVISVNLFQLSFFLFVSSFARVRIFILFSCMQVLSGKIVNKKIQSAN